VIPVGWPSALPAPEDEEFPEQAVRWMLDLGPAEWRTQRVWHDYPQALAHRLRCDLEARREGARTAYGTTRAALASTSTDVERVLTAVEAEGATLALRLREVELVQEALAGRRWRDRL
jgi:hypothetical protein